VTPIWESKSEKAKANLALALDSKIESEGVELSVCRHETLDA